ncbi:MAG: hypothetical protein ACPGUD_02475 [Parashewanella sp.]
MQTSTSRMLTENEVQLERAAFQLEVSTLMNLDNEALREKLKVLAADTPHQCLKLTAEMLNNIRELEPHIVTYKRQILLHAVRRAIANLEKMMLEEFSDGKLFKE